jgi:hypothetical protein
MANRIVIRVLGATLAPYDSGAPKLKTGNVSEDWHVSTEDLQIGTDLTSAEMIAFPVAKSRLSIKVVTANHFNTIDIVSSLTATQIDALAG